jgi:hypothetical protein
MLQKILVREGMAVAKERLGQEAAGAVIGCQADRARGWLPIPFDVPVADDRP